MREASFALPGDAMVARERCAEAEVLGRELGQVDLPSWQTDIDDLDD